MLVEFLGMSVRLTTVVVPVAVYFLVLGLLNSRRHPQLLTGRQDFCLLAAALSPLALVPVLGLLGTGSLAVGVLAVAIGALGVSILLPGGTNWVVYNVQLSEARRVVGDSLQRAGLCPSPARNGFILGAGEDTFVEVSGFPLLRNVSVRFHGSRRLARRFEGELGLTLARVDCETHPMAMALLLVATAMLVAPVAMMAHQVPEIVRILTDLLQ